MAQYDVFELPGGGLVVDVQSDLLEPLNTRIVVPLMGLETAPKPAGRLNPVFALAGGETVMVTQFAAAVRVGELGAPVGSLTEYRDEITAALDMVFHGF